jgi:hypothetical protein
MRASLHHGRGLGKLNGNLDYELVLVMGSKWDQENGWEIDARR